MRKLIGGAIAAALIVVLTPVPAYADGEWIEEEPSPVNSATFKSVTAICPDGLVVIGVGGWTNQADGRVVLTGVVPNETLTAVTAFARALPGHTAPWGVTALAWCAEPDGYEPERESISAASGVPAVVPCAKDKYLYSAGFLVSGGTGVEYVHSVTPSADGRFATVQGIGTVTQSRVSAFAVCGNRVEPYGRTETTVPLNAVGTTAADAPPLMWASWVVGAGVHASRNVFIDGISPRALPDGSGLYAKGRVARLYLLPRLPLAAAMADESDDDVTVYGTSIGSWY